MTERSHPVRKVHEHLRRAASLLSQQQFDAAIAEVDAALVIDAASLSAQALRERILIVRRAAPANVHRPAPGELSPRQPVSPAASELQPRFMPPPELQPRFIPSGVNAESWLGFEQRIQDRRFRGLVDTVTNAVAAGDAIAARVALEEMRELRPDAPELAALSAKVAALPVMVPQPPPATFFYSRTVSAAALLIFGVALLIGLDSWRPDEVRPVLVTPVAPLQLPGTGFTVATAETPVAPDPAPVEPEPPPVLPDQAIGTAGAMSAVAIAPEVPSVSQPVMRRATLVERPRIPSGEIPDDYVAPPRDVVTAAASPAARGPAANVAPDSVAAVTTPSPSAAAAPPAATTVAAPIVPPRNDERGVAQVLNQYARAYGRLDASAARDVWPSVDERALARAFAGLAAQDVSFENCEIDVRGVTANASCRGRASYVGKIGSRETRTESRQWQFELRRDGDAWKIESAEARRLAAF